MNDEPDAIVKTKGISGYFYWPVLVLVLYVLSIGPFAWMANKGIISPSTVDIIKDTVYLPLIWVDENTPLNKPLDMYIDLWGIQRRY